MGITFDTTDSEQPIIGSGDPISLDAGVPNTAVPDEVANQRAFKYSYGLQPTSAAVPQEYVRDSLAADAERTLRLEASSKLNYEKKTAQTGIVQQFLNSKQGPLTQDDMKWIAGTNAWQPYMPDTVMETTYANTYVSELDKFAQKVGDDNFWNQGRQFFSSDLEAAKAFGYTTMAQHEYVNNYSQEVQAQIQNQPVGGRIADTLKIAFPLFNPYYELNMRGNVGGVGFFDGLLGTNLDKQREALLKKDFPDFVASVRAIVEPMREKNPLLAMAFLESLKGYSTTDRWLDNINTIGHGLDVAAPIVAATKLGKSVQEASKLRKEVLTEARAAVKDAIKSNGTPEVTPTNILAGVGDINGAANVAASNKIVADIKGTIIPTKDAIETLPRFLTRDAENIKANPGELTKPQVNILREQYDNFKTVFLGAMEKLSRPDRVPLELATPELLARIQKDIVNKHPELSFLSFSDPVRDPISNTWYTTARVGKPGGGFWTNSKSAMKFAEERGIEGAKLGRQGLSVYLEVTKPIDENARYIQDFLVTKDRPTSQSPGGYTNSVIGPLRTAEDTMSLEQNRNRKAALYPQAVLRAIAEEEGKFLDDLARGVKRTDVNGEPVPIFARGNRLTNFIGKKLGLKADDWKQFKQTLEHNQRMLNPENPDGPPGYTFKDPKELQDHYMEAFNRLPSWTETQAYFSMKRLNEYDRMLREISLYRNKARLGAETHVILSGDGTEKTLAFDGIRRSDLPGGRETFLIVGDKPGKERIISRESMNQKMQEELKQEIAKGNLRVIQIYDPEARPLAGFGKVESQRIGFVIAKNVQTKPLTWEQVNRLGGGHLNFEYDHYIKQAKIRQDRIGKEGLRTYYEGDNTVFPVGNRAMGKQFADKFNEFRLLLKEGMAGNTEKMEAAKKFVADGNLPWEWSEIYPKFQKRKENGKWIPAILDVNEPFHVVPKNTSIIELGKELEGRYAGQNFRDGTREGSLARNFQVEYTGQRDARDLFALVNEGNRHYPVFNMEKAQLGDPIMTMNRALARITNSFLMDDYKIGAVHSWLKEAAPYLKSSITESELRSSPFFHFKTINEDSFARGVDKKIVDSLLANRMKINQLVGQPSKAQMRLHSIAQDLADSAYNYPNVATKALSKVAPLTPEWMLHAARDPFQFVRSVTFNAYLGLFSIPQMFVQNMTWATIYAISPKYAAKATPATYFYQLARINQHPEILGWLDKTATKVGWRPGEWMEARQELHNTGFHHVAGEWGPLDNNASAQVVKSLGAQILSWGQIPFREGERNVRVGAWFTAFKEWRDANPAKAITQADRNQILNRADFLYGNMSTASNSILHTGVLSTATQFYAYNIRLAELFLSGSGRTGETLAERTALRARILGTYGLLFGVPGALGVTGLPAGDYLRKKATESGYLVGENAFADTFMNGLGQQALALATGNYYNVSERYGVGGLTQMRDLLYTDASFWKIIFGASGSMVYNTYNNTDGFVRAMQAWAKGDPNAYPIKIEDFIDFGSEIQSVNRGWQTAVALNSGIWANKNSQILGENVSKLNALFMFSTGLSPQEQATKHYQDLSIKDRTELAQYGKKRALEEMRRGFQAQANNDPQQASEFFARGYSKLIASGWREDQFGSVLSEALRDRQSLIDRSNYDFYVRKTQGFTEEQRKQLLETYSRKSK